MAIHLQNIPGPEEEVLNKNLIKIVLPEAHVSFLPNILHNFPLVWILIVHIGFELPRATPVTHPHQSYHFPHLTRLAGDAESISTPDDLSSFFINFDQSKRVVVDNSRKEATCTFLTSDVDGSICTLS